MNQYLEALVYYLEDEFRNYPDVRVQIRQRSTIMRSVDLEQDYDPEMNDLHSTQGVTVKVRGRDYFFPSEWAVNQDRAQMNGLVEEIKNFLDR